MKKKEVSWTITDSNIQTLFQLIHDNQLTSKLGFGDGFQNTPTECQCTDDTICKICSPSPGDQPDNIKMAAMDVIKQFIQSNINGKETDQLFYNGID